MSTAQSVSTQLDKRKTKPSSGVNAIKHINDVLKTTTVQTTTKTTYAH